VRSAADALYKEELSNFGANPMYRCYMLIFHGQKFSDATHLMHCWFIVTIADAGPVWLELKHCHVQWRAMIPPPRL